MYSPAPLFEILAAQERNDAWLAKKMGYTRSYISRVRHGQKPVTDEFRQRAADVLGLPESVLFFLVSLSPEGHILSREAAVA